MTTISLSISNMVIFRGLALGLVTTSGEWVGGSSSELWVELYSLLAGEPRSYHELPNHKTVRLDDYYFVTYIMLYSIILHY